MVERCAECAKEPAGEGGLCDGCRDWLADNPVPTSGVVVRDNGNQRRVPGKHFSTQVRWWEDKGR